MPAGRVAPTMARRLDRQTLADLTVNFVPLVIMALFGVLFVVYSPWGRFGLASAIQFGLLIVLGGVLLWVSLRSGRAIADSEAEAESETEGE